ncbi:MAG TPA: CRISPR-associated endonuclease Cas1 [Pirellulales bacterium]|jgi:CRISPR-associated protein Cas1|nr:CRISPR-associated endonuclease Cas1 [Pirellulales bacterium]
MFIHRNSGSNLEIVDYDSACTIGEAPTSLCICLPDETAALRLHQLSGKAIQQTLLDVGDSPQAASGEGTADQEIRRLLAARDDLRPLYLNSQGLRVGKNGLVVLKVQDKDKTLQEVRINEICQLNLFGNIQLTTQAIQAPLRAGSADRLLFDGRVT